MAIGNYDSIIAEASRRFQVPEATIRAVMAQESGGKPGEVSSAGAGGLMQIMPATYTELARKHGLGSDRFDPTNNIMGGTAYLRQMNDLFGGDWNDTFGGYNAGPGRWGLVKAGKQNAPAETTDYIKNVNARLGNTGGDVAFSPTIPRLNRPQPGQVISKPQYIPENEQALRQNLIDHPPERDYQGGLGTLTGAGQTPSQPPALKSRIDELIDQLSQPGSAAPAPSQLGFMMAGAQAGAQQLAGVHDRPVGIGELLGAMGGGVTQGYLKGNEAQQQYRQGQFAELGALGKIEEARNKPPKDLTAAVQNAYALGYRPGTQQWNDYITKATLPVGTQVNINNSPEGKAAGALAEGRVKRYEELRSKGENAGKMLDKLGQLETVLDEVGTTGPATPTISKLIGWARQAGVPTEQINSFYQQWTGDNLADPAKVDLAQKLIQDFVTSSIKTLGANPTDTDLATLQQANPSITNQAEANRYIIQHSLRPQYEYERDLWNDVRGIDREDKTLDTLEDRVFKFEQRKREEKTAKAEAERKATDKPPAVAGDPPPQGAVPPEPGAIWSNRANGWVKRDPNWKPGMPGSGWLRAT